MKHHNVIGCIATLTVVAVGTTAPASAQSDDGSQPSPICSVVSMDNTRLLAVVNGVDRTKTVPIDLPSGEVSIPSARAWDAYDGRSETTPQTSERYEVEFIGADGSIVGVSDPTGDVPDGVEAGEWNGPLGTATLSAPAVGVRAHHRNDLPADFSPDSVNAGDFTVCYTPAADIISPEVTAPAPTEPDPTQPEAPATTAAVPTTAVPTTAVPTTAVPTTAVPTTAVPTTAVPTTEIAAGPVAQSTTTAAPTTAAPTTAANTGRTLPVTGSTTSWLLGSAGLLIAGGATLVGITRRHKYT